MRKTHGFNLSVFVLSVGSLFMPALAQSPKPQILRAKNGESKVEIMPQDPGGVTALIDVYSSCNPKGPSLLAKGTQHSVSGANKVELKLANVLSVGESVCAIETFPGGSPEPKIFETVYVEPDPPADADVPKKPVIKPVSPNKSEIYVTPIPSSKGTATLDIYSSCSATGSKLQDDRYQTTVDDSGADVLIRLLKPVADGDGLCAVERFKDPKVDIVSDPIKVTDPPTTTPGVPTSDARPAYSRISAGVDVSSSASVDPAAKFLLDASFEAPLGNYQTPFKAPLWFTGYVRLASIAQPGPISGLSDMASYIKPLTSASPNQLVQSAEANLGLEMPLYGKTDKPDPQFFTVGAIVNAGVVTPLSVSQADPAVYTVTQALYDFYTTPSSSTTTTTTTPTSSFSTTTTVPDPTAKNAITAACGTAFDKSTPCYVTYIPEDRTRFFRNYAVGAIFKKYYYNGGATKAADSFGFPGYVVMTLGQNEYVSGGRLQGLILHLASSWPLPGTISTKWAGALYVYGAMDTNLRSKNISQPQFLLQPAGSSVTRTSDRVAVIPTPQEDRDRYRFGLGVDVLKLVSVLNSSTK